MSVCRSVAIGTSPFECMKLEMTPASLKSDNALLLVTPILLTSQRRSEAVNAITPCWTPAESFTHRQRFAAQVLGEDALLEIGTGTTPSPLILSGTRCAPAHRSWCRKPFCMNHASTNLTDSGPARAVKRNTGHGEAKAQ